MQGIFEPGGDELYAINPKWPRQKLLLQEGWFFFHDVRRHLKLDDQWVREVLKSVKADRGQAQRYGVKYAWRRYFVHMPTFGLCLKSFDEKYQAQAVETPTTVAKVLNACGMFAMADMAPVLGSSKLLLYVYRWAKRRSPVLTRADVGLHRHYEGGWIIEMARFAPHYIAWQYPGGLDG